MATKKSVNEWEDVFKQFDKDGNGSLDVFELRELLRGNDSKITDSQIAEVFVFLEGPTGDKRITLEEFTTGMTKLVEVVKQLTQFFHETDKDNSGSLDKGELRTVLVKVCPKITDAEVDQIFKDADRSGDGKISLEEFLSACT